MWLGVSGHAMTPVTLAPTPSLKRQYPHVDDITDWRAQQSIRLLWDRVFDLEARLQGVEATAGDLVSQANDQEDATTRALRRANEALAEVQATRTEQAAADEAAGESTIPDYSSIVASVVATFASMVVPYADREAGKAQLTRKVAWEIYNTVDTHIGLLAKTSGTQVNGRSVDICVQMTDGSYADVASDHDNGDGTATISGGWTRKAPDSNTADASRWIVPTAGIAAESGPLV